MRILTITLAALLGLAACETVEGVGQDVQTTGQAIENASEDVQY